MAKAMGEWGEPSYFAFVDYSPIYTDLYDGLPRNEFGKTIYLLEFTVANLDAPSSEPIGVYHYAGIRRYLWREKYWNEYNIDFRYFMDRTKELLQSESNSDKALEYRKLLGMLQNYASSGVTHPNVATVVFGQAKDLNPQHFWRVVYKISQKQG